MSTQPDLSIIIVAWNVRDLVLDCLASIRQADLGISVEIILVDNGSEDHTPLAVQRQFPILTASSAGTPLTRVQSRKVRESCSTALVSCSWRQYRLMPELGTSPLTNVAVVRTLLCGGEQPAKIWMRSLPASATIMRS